MLWQRILTFLGRFHTTIRPVERFRGALRHGCLLDLPDERDLLYVLTGSSVTLPSSHDLMGLVSPVRNQREANSCVAHALALLYEVELQKTGTVFDASEQQLYYDGRALADLLPKDTGMYPRDALKVLQKQGFAPEKLCAYTPDQINKEPTLLARSFQPFFKIESYHTIMGLDRVKQELSDDHAVMVVIPLYREFLHCTGYQGYPRGEHDIIGYHAITIIGYDSARVNNDGTTGALRIQNSWGTWAEGGRAWLSEEFLTKPLPGNMSGITFYTLRLRGTK